MKTVTGRVENRDGLGRFQRLTVTETVTSLIYHTHTRLSGEHDHAA
ncbi:hypothetical protein SAMN06297251_10638 [Fulvimarina manganoxydans]|uniref:Uncharacterized protein n=1 Tax=Fulvimarina manganoxydans TaxID=937218 RepID=A0A1W2BBV9_9HYPH|nr:hypothetical protein SAMN06297251_10638 [Fulvimarina manganoxydans]